MLRQMRIYRMLQLHYIRFNACFGTLLSGSHYLFLYIVFVMTSYLLFQSIENAPVLILRIAWLFIVLMIEWCETHWTDSTAESQEFVHKLEAKTRAKRSSYFLPLIRLKLGGGLFYVDLQFREWHVSGWNVSKRFVSFRVRFVSVNFLKRVKGWHETFDPCQLVTRNDWHVSNLDTTRKIRVDTRVKRVKCNVKTLFSSMVLYWS